MSGRTPGPQEQGFVLIAAIWLLILAGSITAILMLRSLAGATAAAEHQDSIERRLALDSAIETMLADRLFNGNRSSWAMAPAAGTIAIGDRLISLSVTSESGRLDVNSADPALIDRALQGFGMDSAERTRIVARLTALRATKRKIGSLPELTALIGQARTRGGACIADSLTWISGLPEPRPDQTPPRAGGGARRARRRHRRAGSIADRRRGGAAGRSLGGGSGGDDRDRPYLRPSPTADQRQRLGRGGAVPCASCREIVKTRSLQNQGDLSRPHLSPQARM